MRAKITIQITLAVWLTSAQKLPSFPNVKLEGGVKKTPDTLIKKEVEHTSQSWGLHSHCTQFTVFPIDDQLWMTLNKVD